jgi:retinol dehydrogenase-12
VVKVTTSAHSPSRIQTNVLSTFLLTALVLPLLIKTATLPVPVEGEKFKPHLVIVTSDGKSAPFSLLSFPTHILLSVHRLAKFVERDAPSIYDAMNVSSTFEIHERYPVTKLMDLLLTRQLSESSVVKGTPEGNEVVVCSVNPGFCRSQLNRNLPEEQRRQMLATPALKTEEGAKNFVWACLEDDIPPGSYVSECAIAT